MRQQKHQRKKKGLNMSSSSFSKSAEPVLHLPVVTAQDKVLDSHPFFKTKLTKGNFCYGEVSKTCKREKKKKGEEEEEEAKIQKKKKLMCSLSRALACLKSLQATRR